MTSPELSEVDYLREIERPSVLKTGAMPAGVEETYEEACARIGVEPRPEG